MRAMVEGAPQKELRDKWMVWKPTPSAGSCTAPAMQPDAALPMICSAPGAGASPPAPLVSTTASRTPTLSAKRPNSESPLKHRDDIAWLHEGLPAGSALN